MVKTEGKYQKVKTFGEIKISVVKTEGKYQKVKTEGRIKKSKKDAEKAEEFQENKKLSLRIAAMT